MSDRSPLVPQCFLQRLSPPPAGCQAISYAVFADGTLALLSTNVDLASEHQRARLALLSSSPLDPPSCLDALSSKGAAQVWTACDPGWVEVFSCPLEKPYPIIDRLNDGRWIL